MYTEEGKQQYVLPHVSFVFITQVFIRKGSKELCSKLEVHIWQDIYILQITVINGCTSTC